MDMVTTHKTLSRVVNSKYDINLYILCYSQRKGSEYDDISAYSTQSRMWYCWSTKKCSFLVLVYTACLMSKHQFLHLISMCSRRFNKTMSIWKTFATESSLNFHFLYKERSCCCTLTTSPPGHSGVPSTYCLYRTAHVNYHLIFYTFKTAAFNIS